MTTKSIAVFCGSRPGTNPVYLEAARLLGQEIAKKNITLIYGGGNAGLMGEVANAVLNSNGKVIGVMPKNLVEREVAHKHLTQLHVVNTMHERKNLMAQLSTGFVAMPGGFGTMDEICEMITWVQLNIHKKSCGFFNVNGFFDHFLKFIEHTVAEDFVSKETQGKLILEQNASRLIEKILI